MPPQSEPRFRDKRRQMRSTTAGRERRRRRPALEVLEDRILLSRVYVDSSATGANNGTSWADAYTDLQTALQSAEVGDEIWVADGVYYPTADSSARNAAFTLKNGVAIYGGFAGTETALDQRDWQTNLTVLSGDIDHNDKNADGNNIAETWADQAGSNSYNVVRGDNVDSTAVLDGFVITAGRANFFASGHYGEGGGIYLSNGASPTLRNLTLSGSYVYRGGGGLSATGGSQPTLTDVTFIGNRAGYYGGGAYIHNSTVTITNSTFTGNIATPGSGGGMAVRGNSSITLTNVSFVGNSAPFHGSLGVIGDGGGLAIVGDSTLTGTDVTFRGNSTAGGGGGLYTVGSSVTLTRAVFENNTANSGVCGGGGLYLGDPSGRASTANLTDVIFTGNTATDGGGGGIGVSNATLTVRRGLIANNSTPSGVGGGFYLCGIGASATLENVTISGNTANTAFGGGGIYHHGDSLTLRNVTIAGNSATSGQGEGLYVVSSNTPLTMVNTILADNGNEDFHGSASAMSVTYSLIENQGNAGLTHGVDGNLIGVDPLLAPLADNGGFSQTHALLPGSPAIDSGTNEGAPGEDQRGVPRPQGLATDMGAFESEIDFGEVRDQIVEGLTLIKNLMPNFAPVWKLDDTERSNPLNTEVSAVAVPLLPPDLTDAFNMPEALASLSSHTLLEFLDDTRNVETRSDLEELLSDYGLTPIDCSFPDAPCRPDDRIVFRIEAERDLNPLALPADNSANTLFEDLLDGLELGGQLDWTPTLVWTQWAGVDAEGFYLLRDGASLSLRLRGGGAVDGRKPLAASNFKVHFQGQVTVPEEAPLEIGVGFWQDLPQRVRTQLLADSRPEELVGIRAEGSFTLSGTHRLEPLGLEYPGEWNLSFANSVPTQTSDPPVEFPSGAQYYVALVQWIQEEMGGWLGDNVAEALGQIVLPFAAGSGANLRPADPLYRSTQPPVADVQWYGDVLGVTAELLQAPNGTGSALFTSEGDRLHRSDAVRGLREVDGTGVRIGILTTGADGLALVQAAGELPAGVRVYAPAGHQGGVGTAVAEVVHDVAPGASLSVAVAANPEVLAGALSWLVDVEGADIIISDVVDDSRSTFRNGLLEELVATYSNRPNPPLFVQAAGDSYRRGYVAELNLAPPDSSGKRWHRWTADGANENILTVPAHTAVRVGLEVSRAALSAQLVPVQVVDGQVKESWNFPQGVVVQRPSAPAATAWADELSFTNTTDQPVEIPLGVFTPDAEAPDGTWLALTVLGAGSLSRHNGGELRGIAAAHDRVLVVGAIKADDPDQLTAETSSGPAFRYNPLNGEIEERPGVDVVAASGITVSGLGYGSRKFAGSAAAAAHAGAVAALLKSLAPDATGDRLAEVLKTTATRPDGADPNRWGEGRIDAWAAAEELAPSNFDLNDFVPPEKNDSLPQWLEALPGVTVSPAPTDDEVEQLLSDGGPLPGFHLTLDVRPEDYEPVEVALDADFKDALGIPRVELSGELTAKLRPDISLILGVDSDGFFVDAGSRVGANLSIEAQATGLYQGVFGIGGAADVELTLLADLARIEAQGSGIADGKLRTSDLETVLKELPTSIRLERPKGKVSADLILGFLDYVDVDPALPNSPNGGDPFVVRGVAALTASQRNGEVRYELSNYRLANPDIDGDGERDYTLNVFGQNVLRYVNELFNGADDRPEDERRGPGRGHLDEPVPEDDLGDARGAKNDILDLIGGLQIDFSIDLGTWLQEVKGRLSEWLKAGAGDWPNDIQDRIDRVQPPPEGFEPPLDEDHDQWLREAVSDWWHWLRTVTSLGFTIEDLVPPEVNLDLHQKLTDAIAYRIERLMEDCQGETAETAVEKTELAIRWIQTAQFLGLVLPAEQRLEAVLHNGCVKLTLTDQTALTGPNPIGPETEATLVVEAAVQVRRHDGTYTDPERIPGIEVFVPETGQLETTNEQGEAEFQTSLLDGETEMRRTVQLRIAGVAFPHQPRSFTIPGTTQIELTSPQNVSIPADGALLVEGILRKGNGTAGDHTIFLRGLGALEPWFAQVTTDQDGRFFAAFGAATLGLDPNGPSVSDTLRIVHFDRSMTKLDLTVTVASPGSPAPVSGDVLAPDGGLTDPDPTLVPEDFKDKVDQAVADGELTAEEIEDLRQSGRSWYENLLGRLPGALNNDDDLDDLLRGFWSWGGNLAWLGIDPWSVVPAQFTLDGQVRDLDWLDAQIVQGLKNAIDRQIARQDPSIDPFIKAVRRGTQAQLLGRGETDFDIETIRQKFQLFVDLTNVEVEGTAEEGTIRVTPILMYRGEELRDVPITLRFDAPAFGDDIRLVQPEQVTITSGQTAEVQVSLDPRETGRSGVSVGISALVDVIPAGFRKVVLEGTPQLVVSGALDGRLEVVHSKEIHVPAGGIVLIDAFLRRGTAALPDERIRFHLQGAGSLDRNVATTDASGAAQVAFFAPVRSSAGTTTIVATWQDRDRVLSERYQVHYAAYSVTRSPSSNQPQDRVPSTPEAEEATSSIQNIVADAVADGEVAPSEATMDRIRDALVNWVEGDSIDPGKPGLKTRLGVLAQLAEDPGITPADYRATYETVGRDFFKWWGAVEWWGFDPNDLLVDTTWDEMREDLKAAIAGGVRLASRRCEPPSLETIGEAYQEAARYAADYAVLGLEGLALDDLSTLTRELSGCLSGLGGSLFQQAVEDRRIALRLWFLGPDGSSDTGSIRAALERIRQEEVGKPDAPEDTYEEFKLRAYFQVQELASWMHAVSAEELTPARVLAEDESPTQAELNQAEGVLDTVQSDALDVLLEGIRRARDYYNSATDQEDRRRWADEVAFWYQEIHRNNLEDVDPQAVAVCDPSTEGCANLLRDVFGADRAEEGTQPLRISLQVRDNETADWRDMSLLQLALGEQREVRAILLQGAAPAASYPVVVRLTGPGAVSTGGRMLTNAQGEIRLQYEAPPQLEEGADVVLTVGAIQGGKWEVRQLRIRIETEAGQQVDRSEAEILAQIHFRTAVKQVALTDFTPGAQEFRPPLEGWYRGEFGTADVPGIEDRLTEATNTYSPEQFGRLLDELRRWLDASRSFGFDRDDPLIVEALNDLNTSWQAVAGRWADQAKANRDADLALRSLQISRRIEELLGFFGVAPTVSPHDQAETLGLRLAPDDVQIVPAEEGALLFVRARVEFRDAAGNWQPAAVVPDIPVTVAGIEGTQVLTPTGTIPNGGSFSTVLKAVGSTEFQAEIRLGTDETPLLGLTSPVVYRAPARFKMQVVPENPGGNLDYVDLRAIIEQGGAAADLYAVRYELVGAGTLTDVGEGESHTASPLGTDESGPANRKRYTPPAQGSGQAQVKAELFTPAGMLVRSLVLQYENGKVSVAPTQAQPAQTGILAFLADVLQVNPQGSILPFSNSADVGQVAQPELWSFDFELPNARQLAEAGKDFLGWAGDQFEVVRKPDLRALVDLITGQTSSEKPIEVVRLKFSHDATVDPASPLVDVTFEGILGEQIAGHASLSQPRIGGDIVFGLDTHPSPFYVLTERPEKNAEDAEEFSATHLTVDVNGELSLQAKEGKALLGGLLQNFSAAGSFEARSVLDFRDVASSQGGKLRLDNLEELASVRLLFPGASPVQSFDATAEGKLQIPAATPPEGSQQDQLSADVDGLLGYDSASDSFSFSLSGNLNHAAIGPIDLTDLSFQIQSDELVGFVGEVEGRVSVPFSRTVPESGPATDLSAELSARVAPHRFIGSVSAELGQDIPAIELGEFLEISSGTLRIVLDVLVDQNLENTDFPEPSLGPETRVEIVDANGHVELGSFRIDAKDLTIGLSRDGVNLTVGQWRTKLQDVVELDLSNLAVHLGEPNPNPNLLEVGQIQVFIPALAKNPEQPVATLGGPQTNSPVLGLRKAQGGLKLQLLEDNTELALDLANVEVFATLADLLPVSINSLALIFKDKSNISDIELNAVLGLSTDWVSSLAGFFGTEATVTVWTGGEEDRPQNGAGTVSLSVGVYLPGLLEPEESLPLRLEEPVWLAINDAKIGDIYADLVFGLGSSPQGRWNGSATLRGTLSTDKDLDRNTDTFVEFDATASIEMDEVSLTENLLHRFELDNGQPGDPAKLSSLVFSGTAQADNVSLGSFDFGGGVQISGTIENLALEGDPINVHAEISLDQVSGRFCAPLGNLLELCGQGSITPNETPQIQLSNVSVTWREGAPDILNDVTFTAGGFGLDLDGSVYVLPGAFIQVDGGREGIAQRLGLPSWIPIDVTRAAIRFENPRGEPVHVGHSPIKLENPANYVLVVSGGIRDDAELPLRGTVEDLEIDLGKLVQGEFPIRNLAGFSIEVDPFTFLEGSPVQLAGNLGFGILENDGGERVMYGRLGGRFTIDSFGFGAELIISEKGPVLGRLQVPLGIPLDPAGMVVLQGVETGIAFGQELVPDDIEDPRQLIDSSQFVDVLDLSDAAIRSALEAAADQSNTTWGQPFTVGIKGTLTSATAPGIAQGDVTLAYNVGTGQDFRLKFIGGGEVTLFGLPLGRAGLILDLDDPLDPRFDLAFRAPAPGNPLGFLLPASGELVVSARAGGLFKAPLLAVRDLAGTLSTELDQTTKNALGEAARRYFRMHPESLLGQALQEAFELQDLEISGEQLLDGLQRILPDSPDSLDSIGDFGEEVLSFFYFVAEEMGESGPSLIDSLTEHAAQRLAAVFDEIRPSLTIRGLIQPTILGFPFGEPTDEVAVSLAKLPDGDYSFGFELTTSLVASMKRQADMISGGTGGLLVGLLTSGAEDRLDVAAQLRLPVSAVQAMLTGNPSGDFSSVTEQLLAAFNPLAGWEVLIGGRLLWNGFELAQIDGILFGPQDQDGNGEADNPDSLFVRRVVNLDANENNKVEDEEIDALSSVQPDSIPIYRDEQYRNAFEHGGLLLTGQLSLPRLVKDPVGLIEDLPALPALPDIDFNQPLEALAGITEVVDAYAGESGYIPTVVDLLMQEETVGALQVFVPSPATLLDADLLSGSSEVGLLHGLENEFRELLETFYIEGFVDAQLLSLELGKARLSATASGFDLETRSPLLAGLETRFGLGWQHASVGDLVDLLVNSPLADVATPMEPQRFGAFLKLVAAEAGLEQVTYPVAALSVDIDSNRVVDVFETFVDANWLERPAANRNDSGISARFEAYTPGYELNAAHPGAALLGDRVPAIDPIQRGGGFRLDAHASVAGLVDHARLFIEAQPFGLVEGDSFTLPYFTAYAHIDRLSVPGLDADSDILSLDGVLLIQKQNDETAAELEASATLLDNFRFDVFGDLEIDENGATGILSMSGDNTGDPFPIQGQLLVLLNTTDQENQKERDGSSFTLPPNSGRLHADGVLNLGSFATEGEFDLQANRQRVSLSGEGTLDLGPFGELDANAELVFLAPSGSTPFGIAGVVNVDAQALNLNLGIFPVFVDANLAVELNTRRSQVVLPSGTVLPRGPYSQLAVSGSDGSEQARVVLFPDENDPTNGALTLAGELVAQYTGEELLAEGGLELSVLDGAVVASVSTTQGIPLRFMPNGIEGSLEGRITVGEVELLDARASLDRFGCFRVDVWPGWEFPLTEGACEPWVYLPERSLQVSEGNGGFDLTVRISEPVDEEITAQLSFLGTVTDISFEPNQTVKTVRLTFNDDTVPEFDEVATVTLVLPDNSPLRTNSHHNRTAVTILDDDCPEGVVVAVGRCERVWQDPVLVNVVAPGGNEGRVRFVYAQSDLNSLYGILPGERVNRPIPTTILDLDAEERDNEPVQIVARYLNPGDSVEVRYVALRDAPGLTTAQYGEDFLIGSGTVTLSRTTFDDPASASVPIGSLVSDNIYEMPERIRLFLEIAKPVAERETLPDHAALRAAADRGTNLRAREAHILIQNDDPERPSDGIVFYNFDALAVDGENISYSFTSDPAYVVSAPAQVMASPFNHSVQLDQADGVDKIAPEPHPVSPSLGASSDAWGVPDWYDPAVHGGNLLANPEELAQSMTGPAPREGITSAYQDVDLSHLASAVDQGTALVRFSGSIKTRFSFPFDSGKFVIRYRDENGADLEVFDSNWLISPFGWKQVVEERVPPPGTRSIRVELHARDGRFRTRSNGRIDVFFDDLRLEVAPHYVPSYYSFTVGLENTRDLPATPFQNPAELPDLMVLSISAIDFWDSSASATPGRWELRSSLDDFESTLASGETHGGEFGHHVRQPLSGLLCLTPQQLPVTFRLVGIQDQNDTWTVDNVALIGSVHPASNCDTLEPPQAVGDSFTTFLDTELRGNVSINDLPGASTSPLIQLASPPGHGTLLDGLASDGSFTYVPAAGFLGEDSFSYYLVTEFGYSQATVTVSVNQPVTAKADQYGLVEDQVLDVASPGVLANDTSADGLTLSARLESGPANGSLELNPDGSFTYRPYSDFSGEDSFTYRAVASGGHASEPVIVTLNVSEVNDPPRLKETSVCIDEDNRYLVDLNELLVDPETSSDRLKIQYVVRTITGRLLPEDKSQRLTRDARRFFYVPQSNFHGPQGLVLIVGASDGEHRIEEQFSICVEPVNDPPRLGADRASTAQGVPVTIPVLQNDRDVDGDSLTLVSVTSATQGGSVVRNGDGTVTYVPPADFAGTDRFWYTASDGMLRRSTSVTVKVDGPPTALDDFYSVGRGQTLAVATPGVLANDADPNGDSMSAELVSPPTHGSITFNTDGSFTYTHDGGSSTSDSFRYRVLAGGQSDEAQAVIKITPVNTAPVAEDATVSIRAGETVTIELRDLAEDSETSDEKLRFALFGRPQKGTATLTGSRVTYSPDASFTNGIDRFKYRVFDRAKVSDTGLITIKIVPNTPPVANDDSVTASFITTGNVLVNDTDADGDNLNAVLLTEPSLGSVQLSSNGAFTYTPPTSFQDCQTTAFSYQAEDGYGGSDEAQVTITLRRGPGPCSGGGTGGGAAGGGFISGGFISRGYTGEALVFLDRNANGVRDFLDINGNGLQDADEPMEPAALSQWDGSFTLPYDAAFDQDKNGRYDAEDGTLVVFGGTDLATGRPLLGTLMAPAGSAVVSPWTTLVTVVSRQEQLSWDDAQALVLDRFGLPEVQLGSLDPISATLSGLDEGPRAFEQGSMIYETIVQAAEMVTTWSGRDPGLVHLALWTALGQMVAQSTAPIDLTAQETVDAFVQAVVAGLAPDMPPRLAESTGRVIGALNQAIGSQDGADGLEFLQRVSAVEAMAQSRLIAAWAALAAGEIAPEEFEQEFTGPGLLDKVSRAATGIIEPVRVSIGDDVSLPLVGAWPQTLEFQVSLSQPSPFPVVVPWSTYDITSGPADYEAAQGRLVFQPGDTEATISVLLHPDQSDPRTRAFALQVGTPLGAVVEDHEATVLLLGHRAEHPALEADLQLDMQIEKEVVRAGEPFEVVVTATNDGPAAATDISVLLDSAPDLTVVRPDPDRGEFDASQDTWRIGELLPGETVTLNLTVRPDQAASYLVGAEVVAATQADPDSVPGNAADDEDDRTTTRVTVLRSDRCGGNVRARLRGQRVIVRGDKSANCLRIVPAGSHRIRIKGVKDTTINGRESALLRGRFRSIDVRLGSGSDRLHIDGRRAEPVSVSVAMGAGDDRLSLRDGYFASLSVYAGAGDDQLMARTVGFAKGSFGTGTGHDSVLLSGASFGSAWIRTGSGDDEIRLADSALGEFLSVRADAAASRGGDDLITIDRSLIEQADLEPGTGANRVVLQRSDFGSVRVGQRAGYNQIALLDMALEKYLVTRDDEEQWHLVHVPPGLDLNPWRRELRRRLGL